MGANASEITNDENPFGNTFDKPVLSEETVSRDYAKSGSPIKATETEEPQPVIDRVSFDLSKFDEMAKAKQVAILDEDDEDDEDVEISQTDHNADLDKDEVALNKKVQAKIAKSQSKNIVGMYIMLLRAAWKWVGKVDEQKLNVMHSKGQIDINLMIASHPLIYHIKKHNSDIDEWEIDEDQEEAIVEALEIYMISKNIQTSPGMNLAMAMGVPLVEMIGRAISQKRDMKALIDSVAQIHKGNIQNRQIQVAEVSKNNLLQQQLEEVRSRNEELMNQSVQTPAPIVKAKESSKTPSSETNGRTVKKNQKTVASPVKSKKAAVQVEPKEA